MTDKLRSEVTGNTALVTIDNPPANTWDADNLGALEELVGSLNANREVYSLVITGQGEKFFSAGADLNLFADGDKDNAREIAEAFGRAFETLSRFRGVSVAAINGYAMGGGFMLVERTDLRVAVPNAIFEVSEAKRWLLGGYNHGFVANLPHPVATEMALGFRQTAERLHQVGFLNRLAEPDALIPTAIEMAEHLLTLPPASRVNTVHMMRNMQPQVAPNLQRLAARLKDHGHKPDLMESRAAFAEKRTPNFQGWDDPADRYQMPQLEED